jgi:hypothetical protein
MAGLTRLPTDDRGRGCKRHKRVALAVVDFFEICIGGILDAVLRRNDLVITHHHSDGAKF